MEEHKKQYDNGKDKSTLVSRLKLGKKLVYLSLPESQQSHPVVVAADGDAVVASGPPRAALYCGTVTVLRRRRMTVCRRRKCTWVK